MMRGPSGALKGGMPFYKYAGNRILTKFENAALGMTLTEFHSGYRAYNLHALASIDFSRMTNDFHFDTEIIIKLNHQHFQIVEIPIPTYYGEELCYVNGLRYARNVYRAVRRYQRTIRSVERCEEFSEYFVHYPMKESRYSSHDYLRRFLGRSKDVLDVGCGEGFLARQLTEDGHRVSGIDMLEIPRHRESFVAYDKMDLDDVQSTARLAARQDRFDYVILLDILEHLRQPEPLLRTAASLLKPHGKIILSVPNVANITVRLGLLLGSFDYTERGILDRTHLKFFTRRTTRDMIEHCGLRSLEEKTTPMPVHLALGVPATNPLMRLTNACLKALAQVLPGLFGYQIMHLIDRPAKAQETFPATKDLERLRDKLNDFGALTAGQAGRHGATQSDSAAR
jgi:2-polyprenyl-3-methyl-5-hydroxy-6-metoxy-1,4-benzoquinol methylase